MHRIHSARPASARLSPRGLPVLLAALLVTAGGLAATSGRSQTADAYLDATAWTAVDARAPVVNLVVEQRATRQTLTLGARRLLAGSRELYVRSADLSDALTAGRTWQDTLRRLQLAVGAQVFTVTGGSRVVGGPQGESLLPVPVLDFGGDLWLPLVALRQVIGPAARLDVAFDDASGRLVLGAADDNIDGVTVELLGRSTAVHVRCRDALTWAVSRPQADLIEVSLRGGRADAVALGGAAAQGLVKGILARQEADRLVVGVRLDDLAGAQRSYAAEGGRDVVVVIEEAPPATLPDPVPAGEVELAIPSSQPATSVAAARLRTVVIDPGHGGADTGAVGRQGIQEKDVNLAVARELKQYLEREGDLEVVLTRSRDEAVDLDARAETANAADGDLFISLHCNSWFDPQAKGFETYFLSPASSDWARSVEAAENGPSGGGREPGDVEFIVWELVQNRFITRSSQFAEFLQERACADLGLPDRGVKQAGFRVLVGAYMPAVLVELGFLSDADEELLLGERGYQRQLARTIGAAVLAFSREPAPAPPAGEDPR
jgi:N-acetylmuramoyl-L-alanine amidase